VIERFYLKEHFSFDECELNFKKGLIAFTGPSGAGKSILMQALLSLFGYGDVNATLTEATVDKNIDMRDYGIENENINIFRLSKLKTARYFINSQNISKKNINKISKKFINYLSVKDNEEFENKKLIELIDAIVSKKKPLHVELLREFKQKYIEYKELHVELSSIVEKEKKVEELKDFARFEISKIDEINPKIGEDEELQLQKKIISKKEKIQTSLKEASQIFNFESNVLETLGLMEEETLFFDECMNELRVRFETGQDRLYELEEVDVESLLERIEKIAGLKKRYGSIEEILAHKEKRIKELKEYENISFSKKNIEKKYILAKENINNLSLMISKARAENISLMNQKIASYLRELYMPEIKLTMDPKELDELGCDEIVVNLGNAELKKISSGEYNRLLLAFLATRQEYLQSDGGVLILDEIDSNLSGKESMSVANVLLALSKKYQIFAISHQPQLSSKAHMHFFVEKDGTKSKVKLLNQNERVEELARMVSGEEIHEKALEFAKSLMEI